MIPAPTLSIYFAKRFLLAVVGVFAGVFFLVGVIDFIEMTRRTGDLNVSSLTVAKISFFRLPIMLERLMPFCVLVGAMTCYLTLSRRLELVVARAAGMSAWQFVAPALISALLLGVFGTTIYNPVSSALQEQSRKLEVELFGTAQSAMQQTASGFWVRQRSSVGEAVVFATAATEKGIRLSGVSVFTFEHNGRYKERIEAKTGVLQPGEWLLTDARVFTQGVPPVNHARYSLPTNLTPEQVQETFANPETVSFWELPSHIRDSENAGLKAAGYRLQYQKLLARPFFLVAMVFLAASVSLRLFRFGGVQQMVLGGVAAGFLLYVLAKIAEDMSKAELMHPIVAAWLPALAGGLTGFLMLLYQEDG
ncbi:MAG: LPS export ABC transporter permease LptG [Pseudorhodoplanes sp.]|nr:Lipopolysaccharide export system permease protein LptG [Pseudorhodoplanes sp.]MBW7950789.1 LPS export ABC transporter permease LptG [Pseudorhodoplanes sp.]MCL4711192.1 LPS export ABC transporter permease LptG [Pseudorhodoplanes sp.]GIK79043.1 MAG: LPS export ABC transporter permease LptG [Alphaproteobacteria bacterium]